MTANGEEIELKDRLRLIESMIAEGRRSTESWGWTFVLWGVAYYVALAWSILGRGHWADWADRGHWHEKVPHSSRDQNRPRDRLHLECDGNLDDVTLSRPEH